LGLAFFGFGFAFFLGLAFFGFGFAFFGLAFFAFPFLTLPFFFDFFLGKIKQPIT